MFGGGGDLLLADGDHVDVRCGAGEEFLDFFVGEIACHVVFREHFVADLDVFDVFRTYVGGDLGARPEAAAA